MESFQSNTANLTPKKKLINAICMTLQAYRLYYVVQKTVSNSFKQKSKLINLRKNIQVSKNNT